MAASFITNRFDQLSKTAGATHGAMIAGLATWLNAASFFALKVINEFRHRGFFDAEAFLAWMRDAGVYADEPWGMSERNCLGCVSRVRVPGVASGTDLRLNLH
jgi:hypothetical protein